MAFAVTKYAAIFQTTANTTAQTVTFGSAPSDGSTVFVIAAVNKNGTGDAATPTATGMTFTLVDAIATASTMTYFTWQANNVSGAGTSVTIGKNAVTSAMSVIAIEISGMAVNPLDASPAPSNSTSSTGSPLSSPASGALQGAGEFAIGAVAEAAAVGSVGTWSNSFGTNEAVCAGSAGVNGNGAIAGATQANGTLDISTSALRGVHLSWRTLTSNASLSYVYNSQQAGGTNAIVALYTFMLPPLSRDYIYNQAVNRSNTY